MALVVLFFLTLFARVSSFENSATVDIVLLVFLLRMGFLRGRIVTIMRVVATLG